MFKKIVAIFASVLLVTASAAPVLADTVIISGNGSDSTSTANLNVTQTTQVQQTNSSNITNNVSSSSNSGGNQASHNTGGSVSVDTGSAATDVTVANTANTNVANTGNCNCGAGTTNVSVTGNGDGSTNTANTTVANQVNVGQSNVANVNNNVSKADSNSGDNGANYNTGGSVSVSTGNATTNVDLKTNANQNLAQLGGSGGGAGMTSVLIKGNGSDTENTVNLGLSNWIVLGQTNSADVENSVHAKSNTGKNSADYNTGGTTLGDQVMIDTGNATTKVSADTAVNFNEASVNCDCLTGGVTAKIADNGASDWWTTNSTINADLVNGQEIGQANGGEGIDNNLNGKSVSGENKTKLNTGASMDPSIMTGDSTSTTEINNQGNANVFGPDMGNVAFTFSLQDFLVALGL